MRVAGRILGWLLVAAAIAAVGAELLASLEAGGWRPLALGELWYRLDAPSLNLAQAVIQRYLLPALWDPVIATVLTWPAWLVAGVPGLVLLFLTRRRNRRRRNRLG